MEILLSSFFLFLSIILLLVYTYGLFNHFIEDFRKTYILKTLDDYLFMLILVDKKSFRTLAFCVSVVFAIIGYSLGNPFIAFVLFSICFIALILGLEKYRRKRIEKFETQLTDALSMMANSLRSGLTLQQTFESVAKEYSNPLAQEFNLFLREVKLGQAFEDSLAAMAKRVDSEDLNLLVISINVSRQLGGNVAEIFDTISNTLRERYRLEGKIRAMTSQGKMQGLIVSALPSVMGIIFYYMRPDLMVPMLKDWRGWTLLSILFIMQVLGLLVIRRIVNVDV